MWLLLLHSWLLMRGCCCIAVGCCCMAVSRLLLSVGRLGVVRSATLESLGRLTTAGSSLVRLSCCQVDSGAPASRGGAALLLFQYLLLQEAHRDPGWVQRPAQRLVHANGSAAVQLGAHLAGLPASPTLLLWVAPGAGGTLTPEMEAWAEQEGMKNDKLQALRNHQKVKKWTKVSLQAMVTSTQLSAGPQCASWDIHAATLRLCCACSYPMPSPCLLLHLPPPPFLQDVDLFAKDYIFVPVHEALHWSLMVVCHPGESLGLVLLLP